MSSLRIPFHHAMLYRLQKTVPCISILGLTILMSLNFQVSYTGYYMPHLVLLAIYYWSLFYPSLMPYWLIFLLGLLFDIIFGLPFGASSLQFLILSWITKSQRDTVMKQPFITMWGISCLILIVAALIQWAVNSLYYKQLYQISDVLIQFMLTATIYPLFHKLMNLLFKLCEYRIAR